MKQNQNQTLIPLLMFGMLLGSMTSQSVLAAEKSAGDATRGARAWAENCTRCHNTRDPRELRDDQWKTTTFHMRLRSGLTGQQTRDIVKFLQESN